MASAPVIPFSTPTYRQPARPAVRIAFIAGEAEQAVSAATADLPAAVQSATLDDLNVNGAAEIAKQTRAFIDLARELLSSAMFPAFLRWGQTAAHLATTCEDDDESERRFDAAAEASAALHAVPSASPHDLTFKMHLIELYEHPRIGELGPIGEDGVCLHSGDPTPLLETLEALAKHAFELSQAINLSEPIGGAMRQAFLDAVSIDDDTSLRGLLIQRNTIMERLNGPANPSGTETDYSCGQINQIEGTILKRSARTADDAVMKLIAVAQVGAEGGGIGDASAISAIADARRFFGVGYLHPDNAPAEQAPVPIVLPEGYDRYMRGPFIAWQKRYEAFTAAKEERVAFERGVGPDGIMVGAPEQDTFDALIDAESKALNALLTAVAPSASELAVKLKLMADGEQWRFNECDGVVEQVTADARRFGRHGVSLKGDASLLDAFTSNRRKITDEYSRNDLSEEEQSALFASYDTCLATLRDNPATTLEGVIAKMRAAFLHMVGEGWSDRAMMDPADPTFVRGLKAASPQVQLAWGAIEDLARIGGVSLSEQGR